MFGLLKVERKKVLFLLKSLQMPLDDNYFKYALQPMLNVPDKNSSLQSQLAICFSGDVSCICI